MSETIPVLPKKSLSPSWGSKSSNGDPLGNSASESIFLKEVNKTSFDQPTSCQGAFGLILEATQLRGRVLEVAINIAKSLLGRRLCLTLRYSTFPKVVPTCCYQCYDPRPTDRNLYEQIKQADTGAAPHNSQYEQACWESI